MSSSRATTVLGSIWTSPNTLLGLILGIFTLQRPHVVGGAIAFDRGPRGFSRFLLAINRVAITLGDVVISAEPLSGRLLAHEREHVRQFHRWGPAFLPAYLALFLVYGYRRNPFEVAADRVASGT